MNYKLLVQKQNDFSEPHRPVNVCMLSVIYLELFQIKDSYTDNIHTFTVLDVPDLCDSALQLYLLSLRSEINDGASVIEHKKHYV